MRGGSRGISGGAQRYTLRAGSAQPGGGRRSWIYGSYMGRYRWFRQGEVGEEGRRLS